MGCSFGGLGCFETGVDETWFKKTQRTSRVKGVRPKSLGGALIRCPWQRSLCRKRRRPKPNESLLLFEKDAMASFSPLRLGSPLTPLERLSRVAEGHPRRGRVAKRSALYRHSERWRYSILIDLGAKRPKFQKFKTGFFEKWNFRFSKFWRSVFEFQRSQGIDFEFLAYPHIHRFWSRNYRINL